MVNAFNFTHVTFTHKKRICCQNFNILKSLNYERRYLEPLLDAKAPKKLSFIGKSLKSNRIPLQKKSLTLKLSISKLLKNF